MAHSGGAEWVVIFDDAFVSEFRRLDEAVQDAILAYARALAVEGSRLGRPFADTQRGSRHANMKELRPTVNRIEWRVAYAFDPERKAILLAAAAKGGRSDRLVYRHLINVADRRFAAYLRASADRRR